MKENTGNYNLIQDRSTTFPEEIEQGLWVLGNYFFNLYLLQGEQAAMLIEAGVSAVADSVKAQLRRLAIAPTFLVVTHPHADHISGLPAFREFYPQLIVVAGRGAPEFLSHPKAQKSIVAEDAYMSSFLAGQGLAPGRPPITESPTLENCLIARDGNEIDLGGMHVRFMEVQGHSPGKIVVHIPERRTLILSDSLGFRYPGRGFFPLFLTSYPGYRETLERLEDLHPEIVGLAHQGHLMGPAVQVAFSEARNVAQEVRERIRQDKRSLKEITQELFEEYYRDECRLYSPENIMNCVRLLVKRARE